MLMISGTKKVAAFLFLTLSVLLLEHPRADAAPGDYLYATYGGRAGFVILDEDLKVNAAFEIGSHAGFAFDLGQWGELHYVPMISWWFGGNRDGQGRGHLVSEVGLNLLDYRYYFPIKKSYTLQPFIGAAPMGAITVRQQEVVTDSLVQGQRHKEKEREIGWQFGLNLYGGADFVFSDQFRMFAEVRIRRAAWDVAKLSLGFSFTVR
ncbi:MAG: hypothetical protein ACOCW2_00600 [Chitinivibrionales bacterium]